MLIVGANGGHPGQSESRESPIQGDRSGNERNGK